MSCYLTSTASGTKQRNCSGQSGYAPVSNEAGVFWKDVCPIHTIITSLEADVIYLILKNYKMPQTIAIPKHPSLVIEHREVQKTLMIPVPFLYLDITQKYRWYFQWINLPAFVCEHINFIMPCGCFTLLLTGSWAINFGGYPSLCAKVKAVGLPHPGGGRAWRRPSGARWCPGAWWRTSRGRGPLATCAEKAAKHKLNASLSPHMQGWNLKHIRNCQQSYNSSEEKH